MKYVTIKKIIFRKKYGERIDKFLAREFFSLTRGEIIRRIRDGKILVNEKVVKSSYILKEGDIIETVINEQGTANSIYPNNRVKPDIIYQDKNIIAINKPAGIQVHPDFHEKENTVVNGLLVEFPEIKMVGDNPDLRPGIVHRLDKDTSGILVVARNQRAFYKLKEMFQTRRIVKKYLAIVYGILESREGIINKPLARSTKYKKQVVAGKKTRTKIREAVTEYKVQKEFSGYSLVEVTPKTGRFHQIRTHFHSIGHPVAGDRIYKSKNIKNNVLAKRQLLHAFSLQFSLDGENYELQAPLAEDFKDFLDQLDYRAEKS